MSEDRPQTGFSASETSSETNSERKAESVEPIAVTYRCRPEGFVCAACGAETTTQWFDGSEFVCPGCTSWT